MALAIGEACVLKQITLSLSHREVPARGKDVVTLTMETSSSYLVLFKALTCTVGISGGYTVSSPDVNDSIEGSKVTA